MRRPSYYYLVSNYFNPEALESGVWCVLCLVILEGFAVADGVAASLQVGQSKFVIAHDYDVRDLTTSSHFYNDCGGDQLLTLNMVGAGTHKDLSCSRG